MRLGTCIAVEAVVILAALSGATWGATRLAAEWRGPDAEPRIALDLRPPRPLPPPPGARAPVPPTNVSASPSPSAAAAPSGVAATAAVAVAPVPAAGDPLAPVWRFGDADDEQLLAPLRAGRPARVKVNRGGTSLSLRLDLDNGARGAFKPDQVFGQSNPRREIAAYRIDRLLGIGRVPPAIPVSYTLDELIAAVDRGDGEARTRLRTDTRPRGAELRGELSWWVPVLADARIGGARIDETDGIVTWRAWLKAGATIPPDRVGLCQQLSMMTLFDFVIDNTDRWTGNNAKVSADGAVLYFMDNTLAFGKNRRGHDKSHRYLQRVQTFSRRLVARLRALDEAQLRAVLADAGPFERLLTDEEIAAVLGRRDRALAYVDGLIATHGEAKVLAFP